MPRPSIRARHFFSWSCGFRVARCGLKKFALGDFGKRLSGQQPEDKPEAVAKMPLWSNLGVDASF